MPARSAPRPAVSPLSVPGHRTIIQGEYATSGDADAMFSTILGSCVAVCLHDPLLRIGGMNHFLLPEKSGAGLDEMSHGLHAMELLINDMLKRGAAKTRMTAKLFGGAHMIEGLSDVGPRNAEFAKTFITSEGILLAGESLGGTQARKIRFWPHSGRAQQMLLGAASAVKLAPPKPPVAALRRQDDDVELF
jgi:chemotaxis protein CheD